MWFTHHPESSYQRLPISTCVHVFVYFQQGFSILANFSFSRVCKHTSQIFSDVPPPSLQFSWAENPTPRKPTAFSRIQQTKSVNFWGGETHVVLSWNPRRDPGFSTGVLADTFRCNVWSTSKSLEIWWFSLASKTTRFRGSAQGETWEIGEKKSWRHSTYFFVVCFWREGKGREGKGRELLFCCMFLVGNAWKAFRAFSFVKDVPTPPKLADSQGGNPPAPGYWGQFFSQTRENTQDLAMPILAISHLDRQRQKMGPWIIRCMNYILRDFTVAVYVFGCILCGCNRVAFLGWKFTFAKVRIMILSEWHWGPQGYTVWIYLWMSCVAWIPPGLLFTLRCHFFCQVNWSCWILIIVSNHMHPNIGSSMRERHLWLKVFKGCLRGLKGCQGNWRPKGKAYISRGSSDWGHDV